MKIVNNIYTDDSIHGDYILYHRDSDISYRHREDGPAFEYINGIAKGENSWWFYNQRHSFNDKPARTTMTNGVVTSYTWFDMGMNHRVGGPAIISIGNYTKWMKQHRLHRLNAPAVICIDDKKQFWEFGNFIK